MRTKLPSNPTSVPEPLTPEESDERNRLAEKLDRQIRELTQTSQQSFQSVIRAFANCLGAPDEQDKNRLIWHGIVGYANADLGSARGIEEGIIAFDIFTSLCMNRLPNSFLEWKNPREDLSPFEDMESAPTRVAYTRKARTLQKQFRTMLFWLA